MRRVTDAMEAAFANTGAHADIQRELKSLVEMADADDAVCASRIVTAAFSTADFDTFRAGWNAALRFAVSRVRGVM